MRIDEAMLERIGSDDARVHLRIYRWSEPTLSLGHFQDPSAWSQDPRTIASPDLATLPSVRRKTGGGAILHDEELTYCLVISGSHRLSSKGHSEGLYRAVHDSVRDGLRELGLDAHLSESCTCSKEPTVTEPFLCFERRSPVDVVVGNAKVLGSAQRRNRRGLLQHGSFLLRASAWLPSIVGVEQLLQNAADLPDWESWLEARIRLGLNRLPSVNC